MKKKIFLGALCVLLSSQPIWASDPEIEELSFFSIPAEVIHANIFSHMDIKDIEQFALVSLFGFDFLNNKAAEHFDLIRKCFSGDLAELFLASTETERQEVLKSMYTPKILPEGTFSPSFGSGVSVSVIYTAPLSSIEDQFDMQRDQLENFPWSRFVSHFKYYQEKLGERTFLGRITPVILPFLEFLNISRISFEEPDSTKFMNDFFVNTLGDFLQNSGVELISFDDCSEISKGTIVKFMKKKNDWMRFLSLKGCKLEVYEGVCSQLADYPLDTLSFSRMTAEDVGVLSQSFVSGTFLERLSLRGDGVGSESMWAFFDQIDAGVYLRELSLNNNTLGDGWAEPLVDKFSDLGIEDFSLSNCSVSDASALDLSKSFAESYLRVLSLTNNNFTLNGLRQIARGLLEAPQIERISAEFLVSRHEADILLSEFPELPWTLEGLSDSLCK